MRRSKLVLAALAALSVALSSGCRATIPDGRFGCRTDADCPPGQSCIAEVCRLSLGDAGVPDAGLGDGGPGDGGHDAGIECDDGFFCNGVETYDELERACAPGLPPCAAELCDEDADQCRDPDPDPIRVRFVHVAHRRGTVRFEAEGTRDVPRSYGSFSDVYTVPWPSDGMVDVAVELDDGTLNASFPAAPALLVVLGPLHPDALEALYAFPDDLAPNGETPTFRYLNMMITRNPVVPIDLFTYVGDEPPEVLPLGSAGPIQDATPVTAEEWAAGLELHELAGTGIADAALAGFIAPVAESSWLIFHGDLRLPPGADFGPRVTVVGREGRFASIDPDPLTGILNASEQPVFACVGRLGTDNGSRFTVHPGQVSPPFPHHPFFDLAVTFAATESAACDPTGPGVPLSALPGRQRHLVVVTGDSTGLEAHTISEPLQFDDLGGMSMLVLANYSVRNHLDLTFAARPSEQLFENLGIGEHGIVYVPTDNLVGTISITDENDVGDDYVLTADDATDALFLIYVSTWTEASLLRSVAAPFGGEWRATTR